MAKDNKINMPSGMGGLVRYNDVTSSFISFKPGHVVVMAIIFMIIVLLMHLYGNSVLGI